MLPFPSIIILLDFKSNTIKDEMECYVNFEKQKQTNKFLIVKHCLSFDHHSALYFTETHLVSLDEEDVYLEHHEINKRLNISKSCLVHHFQGYFYPTAFQANFIIPPYLTSLNNIPKKEFFQQPSPIRHGGLPQQECEFKRQHQMDDNGEKGSQTLNGNAHNLQQQLIITKAMKNYSEENYETSDSQPYHPPLPFPSFLYTPQLLIQHSNLNLLQSPFHQNFQPNHYYLKVDQQFTKRTNTNIVLQLKKPARPTLAKKELNQQWNENKKDCYKAKTKTCQKQSRNVYSNVLRIFFKCILELKTYESLIQKILQNLKFKGDREDFYAWLLGFNINFKNYIRSTQMKRILVASGCDQFKKVMMVLLRHYLKNHAVTHCLTSKRIELSSLKMHLSGLRELYHEVSKMKLPQL